MATLDITAFRGQIQKTLQPLNLYSPAAEELLCATCAQESLLGAFRRQIGGPALGIFQMEPADFTDIWQNYLAYHQDLAGEVGRMASTQPPRPVELVTNDPFAIAMCRVHYLRAPAALPAATDLAGLWAYYKQYYNTPAGAATQAEFIHHYNTLVKGEAK